VAARGDEILTFAREKDGDRRPRLDVAGEAETPPTRSARSRKKSDSPEVGSALRSVYQRTVDEQIPPDLLDLLGKLS
jgi:hypothetical protein